jgi:hypothetical protein
MTCLIQHLFNLDVVSWTVEDSRFATQTGLEGIFQDDFVGPASLSLFPLLVLYHGR